MRKMRAIRLSHCATYVTVLALLFWLQALPARAVVLFSDDFNRPDNATVGNGWTEVDESNLKSSIESGALKMSQVAGLPASTNDTQDTRVYRFGGQHNGIVLSGTLRMDRGLGAQVARVVVRSGGTEGAGFCTNQNTGAIIFQPCGEFAATTFLCPFPGCWSGDGFGFAANVEGNIQITDAGVELAQTAFSFADVVYQWEMQINGQNHILLLLWTGSIKPLLPTLEFTNGGVPYVPTANGDNWQIEVRNSNDNQGSSHEHRAHWDNFQVETLSPPISCAGDPPVSQGGCTVNGVPNQDCLGTPGPDLIIGTDGNDVIRGLGHDDTIDGGAGNDCLDGGARNDVITAGNGNNTILTGDGHNRVTAGNGTNMIMTDGLGNNTITTGNGANTITTGTGHDRITTGSGDDTIDAGSGNNVVTSSGGTNVITTTSGHDNITTGDGVDMIAAGDGHNVVSSGGEDDTVTTGTGHDRIDGGAGTLDSCEAGTGINVMVNCELP